MIFFSPPLFKITRIINFFYNFFLLTYVLTVLRVFIFGLKHKVATLGFLYIFNFLIFMFFLTDLRNDVLYFIMIKRGKKKNNISFIFLCISFICLKKISNLIFLFTIFSTFFPFKYPFLIKYDKNVFSLFH